MGNLFVVVERLNLVYVFYKIGGGKVLKLFMFGKIFLEKVGELKGFVGNCFNFFFCGNINFGEIMFKIMFGIFLMVVFSGGYFLGKIS